MMCLSMDFLDLSCLGFILPLEYRFMPLFKFGEILGIISSNIFPAPFFFFFSWDSDDMNVKYFVIVPQVLDALFIFFSLFSVFRSDWVISTHLTSSLQILSSIISSLLSRAFRIFKFWLLYFSVPQFPLSSLYIFYFPFFNLFQKCS